MKLYEEKSLNLKIPAVSVFTLITHLSHPHLSFSLTLSFSIFLTKPYLSFSLSTSLSLSVSSSIPLPLLLSLPGEAVPVEEQHNSKEKTSEATPVIETLAPPSAPLLDEEKTRYEGLITELYQQLDDKVGGAERV